MTRIKTGFPCQKFARTGGIVACLVPVLAFAHTGKARAQDATTQEVVAQTGRTEERPVLPVIRLYAMASVNNREAGLPSAIGFTGGASLQLRPHWSAVEEASMTHWHSTMHTYTVLVGPRWAASREAGMAPFFELLGGIGHAGAVSLPTPVEKQYGIATGIATGVNYRLSRELSFRLGQVNLTHIFAGRGWTSETASMGLVVRAY